jgi:hypothetical protein
MNHTDTHEHTPTHTHTHNAVNCLRGRTEARDRAALERLLAAHTSRRVDQTHPPPGDLQRGAT